MSRRGRIEWTDRSDWNPVRGCERVSEGCRLLAAHGEALGIAWGWREDPAQGLHNQVLYIDLPTGQVSFHAASRGEGPDYDREWDGKRHQAPIRICAFIASLGTEAA